jgi:hypothetical protein
MVSLLHTLGQNTMAVRVCGATGAPLPHCQKEVEKGNTGRDQGKL